GYEHGNWEKGKGKRPHARTSCTCAWVRQERQTMRSAGTSRRTPLPAPRLSRLHEAQRHAVAFTDRLVFVRVGGVMVVGRRQRPHAVGVILGVARVGVDLAAFLQLEAGRLG